MFTGINSMVIRRHQQNIISPPLFGSVIKSNNNSLAPSASVLRNATPSFVLLNSAPHSASAAEDITFLMMIDVVSIAPLLTSGLFEDLSPR
jgi:hypothetical protein